MDELARAVLSILDDPVILSLAERLAVGELGCRACGETFPRAGANGKLICPHCGANLREHGYLDGADVADITVSRD